MGGGLGIFRAADFRLVAENVRIAMPEVTIGLFPDAGGTWLLKNMPEHQALFIGMTGAHLNAGDAMLAGIGTHAVDRSALEGLVAAIAGLSFSGDAAADRATIASFLDQLDGPELPPAELGAVTEAISTRMPVSWLRLPRCVRCPAHQPGWIKPSRRWSGAARPPSASSLNRSGGHEPSVWRTASAWR